MKKIIKYVGMDVHTGPVGLASLALLSCVPLHFPLIAATGFSQVWSRFPFGPSFSPVLA